MSGAEMKLVSDGKREIEEILALRSLLQAALNWGEDELSSGGTDGD